MDQISPPMRIVLAVAVVFLAAYMLVLKPSGETTQPAVAPVTPATESATDANPAQTELGKAVEKARGAADATEKQQNAASGEAETTKPGTSSSTTTKPSTTTRSAKPVDKSLAALPEWLQESIDKKVVAILFTNNRAADDRRTRDALKHAFTAHGKVVTRAVPIGNIARYRPVAQGVDVQQSPTLMVIDRKRSAQSLVGYSSRKAVNQAIVDGLLATAPKVSQVPFLRTVRSECRSFARAKVIDSTSNNTFGGSKQDLNHIIAVGASALGTVRNAAAAGPYKPLKKTVIAYLSSEVGIYRSFATNVNDRIAQRRIAGSNDKLQYRAGLELAAVGISACT